MKNIFTLLLTFSAFYVFAQTAPDFTLYDLEGEPFTLSEKLAENKAVVIDFSTTWCGPCWSLHQSGVLEDVYAEYGPDGEDILDVIWVESDEETNDDCMYGLSTCNNSTQGDWVTGTTFRMFNPSSTEVPESYPVDGYPTVIVVSAIDGTIILKDNFPDVSQIGNIVHDKGILQEGLELEILDFEMPASVCDLATVSVKIRNKSLGVPSDTKVDLSVDDEVVATQTIAGDFNSGEIVTLTFEDIYLSNDVNKLEVKVDVDDNNNANNKSFGYVVKKELDNQVDIFIKKNTLKGKTQFHVEDTNGDIVFESGSIYPGKDYSNHYSVDETGCTKIVFTDPFEKGIVGENALKISDSSGKVLYEGDLEGGNSTIGYITSEIVSVGNIEFVNQLALTPNPVTGNFYLQIDLEQSAHINTVIYNNLGQEISTKSIGNIASGNHSIAYDVDHLEAGIYILQLEINGELETRKFIKQ